MNQKLQLLFTLLMFFCFFNEASAQKEKQKKLNYEKHPYWIDMMDDPNVNYHQAVSAFDQFWKGRGEPEHEREGAQNEEHEKRSLLERVFKSDEKLQEENQKYAIDYKRFNQWKRDVEPYVQSDGSILSKEEQMRIWENSRK